MKRLLVCSVGVVLSLGGRSADGVGGGASPRIVPSGTIYLSKGCFHRIVPVREIQGMSPKQIGQFVRGVRRKQGLRQDQLAAAAGVGVRFLVEVERGKPTAQLGKVLAVLDALGCTLRIEPPPSVDDSQAGR